MSCGSCGTGKPGGCQSHGSCGTGSCNRMNVFDWLMNLPFSDPESNCRIVEVSFKNGSRKDYFRNATMQHFDKGDYVTVEGTGGYDVGEVSLSGELVRMQLKKHNIPEFSPDIKKILRASTDRDLEGFHHNKLRDQPTLMRSREIARDLKLQMKLSEVEFQADGKKATFFYTADDRIDFREMIKMFAAEFKVKVEMRQIGIRQEAGKVGGIGSCGRELCCSTWLTDFKSVTTTAARYQNLSINQTKLSGQCGRLKCCLNFELDSYLDALQGFPHKADFLETEKGRAMLIKKDIFKNLMWYTLPDSNKQYPLTIKRVKEILALNQNGEKAKELGFVELHGGKEAVEVDAGFVDVVGHISLKTLERDTKRRKERNYSDASDRRNNRRPDNNPNNRKREQQPNNNNRPSRPQQTGNAKNTNQPKNEGGLNPNARPQQKMNPNQNGGVKKNNNTPPQGNRPKGPRPNQGPQQRGPRPNNPNTPKGEQ